MSDLTNKLMNLKPSEFYLKLWKGYYSGKLSEEKKNKLVKLYEDYNSPGEAIDEVFEIEPETKVDFLIHEPIWKDKTIGINEAKLKEINIIEIDFRLKDGTRLYPDLYSMTKEKILTYPVQKIRGNKLRIIPIKNLEIYAGG